MENNISYSKPQLELLNKILNERIKFLEIAQSKGYKKEIKEINKILNAKPRKEPLVIKIADFTKDKHEPAFDVEIFENGVFMPEKSWITSTKDLKKLDRDRVYKKLIQEVCYRLLKML